MGFSNEDLTNTDYMLFFVKNGRILTYFINDPQKDLDIIWI